MCNKICGIEWFMLKNNDNNTQEVNDLLLICETCFENGNIPKDLKKEDFEVSNVFSIVDPNESRIFYFLFSFVRLNIFDSNI